MSSILNFFRIHGNVSTRRRPPDGGPGAFVVVVAGV
jgi:hypothetical protein